MLSTVNDYIEAGLTHSIHTSERRSFRGCRRRWDWISRQFYYPRVTPRPLEFGVAFHAAMEAAYRNRLELFVDPDPTATLAIALATFKRVTREQREKYIRLNGGIDDEMKADYDDRVRLGEGMLRYYFGKLYPDVDRLEHFGRLKPVKVEIKFEVPILNPDTGEQDLWCKCDWCWRRFKKSDVYRKEYGSWERYLEAIDELCGGQGETAEQEYFKIWKGLPVTYGGRLDILFEDEFGNYWIGDWKTAARLSGVEVNDEYLELDDQITSYVWALRMLGLPILGFIYMELKKAVPDEPEPLKVVRLGRRFSVSKNLDTTYDLYKSTVEENDPIAFESGRYDDFLDYLKEEGPIFHYRHEVQRNDSECEEAQRMIYLEARDMTNPSLPIYPNAGRFHCKGFSTFSGCAFFEVCLGTNRGEDVQYGLNTMFDKLDRHYWEDQEPSTDKRMEQV